MFEPRIELEDGAMVAMVAMRDAPSDALREVVAGDFEVVECGHERIARADIVLAYARALLADRGEL